MKNILKVEYLIDDYNMNDEEFNNQEFKTFYVTDDMIRELVEKQIGLSNTQSIDENFYIYKI